MKKLSMAMAAAMLFTSCACFTVNAEGGMILKAVPEKDTLTPSDTTLAVAVDFENNFEGFNTIGFEVAYPEGYTFTDGAIDEVYHGKFWLSLGGYEGATYVIVNDAENNKVRFVGACLNNVMEAEATLCTLNFAVPENSDLVPGDFVVTIIDDVFAEHGGIVQTDAENGSVTYDDGPVGIRGDVDMDGSVSATDALYALMLSIGAEPEGAYNAALAEVDGEEGISATDALLILQISIGAL